MHGMAVIVVSVRTFRAQTKHWLDRVLAGDEVVITRRDRPVARLVPESHDARYPLRGSIKSMAPDFDRSRNDLWDALRN